MKLDQLSMEYMSTARVSEASPGPGAAAPLLRLLRAGAGQPRAAQRGGAELWRARETPGGTDSQLSETPGLDRLAGQVGCFLPYGHGLQLRFHQLGVG